MDETTLARTLAEAVTSALEPLVIQLDERLAAVEDRVAANVPRRPITDTTKRRHRDVVAALGGRCPCCGIVEVLDGDGKPDGAEYDHFYSRERREFADTWLICRSCHRGMRDRAAYTVAFNAYQQRSAMVEEGQLNLFSS